MIKDKDGKNASIPLKIKGSAVKFKHKRLAATTTRSYSIQDNVLCIITAMDLGGNRETTLQAELKSSGATYDALRSSGNGTTNYIFYSIELPH